MLVTDQGLPKFWGFFFQKLTFFFPVVVNYCEKKYMSNIAIVVVSFWQEELMFIFYTLLQLKINKSGSHIFCSNLEVRYLQGIQDGGVLERNPKPRARVLGLLYNLREQLVF